jgi:uncharacterized protein (DUF1501 family)
MNDVPTFQTRREFLRRTVLGGALTWTVPGFLAHTFSALQADTEQRGALAPTGKDSTILVVVQLAGGNDGLNTVVPYTNDWYRKARPRLRIEADQVLNLSDEVGLHPGLAGLKELFDEGHLAVVQGVGYPNPNRSHFRSTEIWQTAADANRVEPYGWIGRYFDNACDGADPVVGISIGRQMPLAFAAHNPKGVSLDNPESYGFLPPKGKPDEMRAAEESFRKLNDAGDDHESNSGGTIGALAGAAAHTGSALDFIERTALDAQVSSDKIREIARRAETRGSYPGSQLGSSLKLIAKLIGGGLPTRIFYASQGGYDTHTNQAGTQDRLLRDLGGALKAFVGDLQAQGNLERVLVMTFSEFGRRVAENASGGTDHGAAAPMFLIGNKLKAGLVGAHPSLAPEDLFLGDIRHRIDFRSVYASVLERWLKTPSVPVLGKQFPQLPIVP